MHAKARQFTAMGIREPVEGTAWLGNRKEEAYNTFLPVI
jgi:hypothetical protein